MRPSVSVTTKSAAHNAVSVRLRDIRSGATEVPYHPLTIIDWCAAGTRGSFASRLWASVLSRSMPARDFVVTRPQAVRSGAGKRLLLGDRAPERCAPRSRGHRGGADTISTGHLYGSDRGAGEELAATAISTFRDLTIEGAAAGTTFVDAARSPRLPRQPMKSQRSPSHPRRDDPDGATTDSAGAASADEGDLDRRGRGLRRQPVSGTTSPRSAGRARSRRPAHGPALLFFAKARTGAAPCHHGTRRLR